MTRPQREPPDTPAPTPAGESTSELSPAGEVFAAFLARRENGDAVDFEVLCAEHTGLAEKLRRLHRHWRLLSNAMENPAADDDQQPAELETLRREAPDSDRLTVRDELGRGGRGLVLRVWDKDLRRELAMKVLLRPEDLAPGECVPTPTPSSRSLVRFLEEAAVTGQLDHPGIPPVHELGLDAEGRVYFTMPVIRGDDFRSIMRCVRENTEGWTRTRALNVLLRVCEALAHAHARGVVHRDVKPSNIMVGSLGETYVIDWGLARTPAAGDLSAELPTDVSPNAALLTADGDVLGTPAYMAPEQARGELGRIGPPADVYAVGAMLYELLTGRAAHAGETLGDVLEVARSGGAPALRSLARDVPPELEAICARAMARDPDDRYPTTAELAEDLRAFLELRVVQAYRIGAVAELSLWVRRNRGLAGASAAAVLLLLAGLAASLSLYGMARRRAEDVLRLSALRDLEELERSAQELWPATPALETDYVAWLDRGEELLAELPAHRARLAELRQSSGVDPEHPSYPATRGREGWWDRELVRLIGGLERLGAPEAGLMSGGFADRAGWSIPRRLAFARELEQRSTAGPDADARWTAAAARARELYDGLELRRQLGLVPLGEDPDSGLLEFLLVGTGEEPERGADGLLEVTPATGVVLVLLPGGRFDMGAQSNDPSAPGYQAEAAGKNQHPVHEIELDPFFLGKYEVSQGQWLRAAEANPSGYPAGASSSLTRIDLTHPVEQISRDEAAEFARRLGARLPTEAQWEYACRAGTTTEFETGDEVRTLEGYANLADEGSARAWNAGWQHEREFFDDYDVTSPVGALLPSRFGLHDMHGNVWEWCADDYGSYERGVEPGTGRRLGAQAPAFGVSRGGSYYCVGHSTRCAYRSVGAADTSSDDCGMRLARRLER